MSVLMSFAMFPTDKGDSVSPYVSKIVNLVSESGFDYKFSSMCTIVEFETMTQALDLLNKAYDLLESDCKRVYSTVTFDIQTNKPIGRIEGKVKSVENKLNKPLNK